MSLLAQREHFHKLIEEYYSLKRLVRIVSTYIPTCNKEVVAHL